MRYEVALSIAALLLGYLVFSFVYVALSNNTWIGRGISAAAKSLYVYPIKKIFKSENTVLYMGTVKVIVAGSFAAFVSIIFIPYCIIMSLFAAFDWGVAMKRLKEELVSLQATLN